MVAPVSEACLLACFGVSATENEVLPPFQVRLCLSMGTDPLQTNFKRAAPSRSEGTPEEHDHVLGASHFHPLPEG